VRRRDAGHGDAHRHRPGRPTGVRRPLGRRRDPIRDRGLGLIEVLRGDDDAPRIWHGWRLLVSGAALSLDDLAVGLALGTVRFPILLAVTAFGLMSFVMSIIGLQLGAKLGTVTGERGEVVAGIMLVGLSGVMAMGWL